jgi:hypothetical protein
MLVWNRVKCAWEKWHGSRAAWLKLPHVAGAVGACIASGLVIHSLPLGPSDSGFGPTTSNKPPTLVAPSAPYIAVPNQFDNYGYTNGNFPLIYNNVPPINLAPPINVPPPPINLIPPPPINLIPPPPINLIPPPNLPPPNLPPTINKPPPTNVPEPSSFYVLITACLMLFFLRKRSKTF